MTSLFCILGPARRVLGDSRILGVASGSFTMKRASFSLLGEHLQCSICGVRSQETFLEWPLVHQELSWVPSRPSVQEYFLSVLPNSRPHPAPPSSALLPHQILRHPRVHLTSPETSSLALIHLSFTQHTCRSGPRQALGQGGCTDLRSCPQRDGGCGHVSVWWVPLGSAPLTCIQA